MNYCHIWVRSSRYHSGEALTYSSENKLATGSIVQVELQNQLVMGVVVGVTSKPRFNTKPVTRVFDLPPIPNHLIKTCLWLQQYYPAPIGIISQQLLPASLSEKQLMNTDTEQKADDWTQALKALPALNSSQKSALDSIQARDTYLLHGITGSGKTRLYIELTARSLVRGYSSIILTPEISLTSQLAASFRAIFGKRVVVIHSNQTPAERQSAWLNCLRSKEPLVIIGPRSALFSPVQKLGLIVMDEAHESAYKQQQSPQYQTGRVAAFMAPLTRATLVLGSATPSISDYYLAKEKNRPIIELNELAQPGMHQPVKIVTVDMKDRSQFGKSQMLSQPLTTAISEALNRGEQSLLYLNRRGTARLVLCSNCGWQATCPHCDIPLAYHGDKHALRCHSCDYQAPAPSSCPTCGHADIIYKSAGTKAIVQEVERLFPGAKVARFDTDNSKAERFEQHYQSILDGNVDILVGTQLLAKGLDLPKLSALGVVLADTSLYLPDFSSAERTFQLISQVLGRIGRGHLAGKAIIQSYNPDNAVIQSAINGDYQGFYKSELAERQQFNFPPFCYLLKLSCRRASLSGAENAALKLKSDIDTTISGVKVEGPAPAFYERLQNKYQWQLVVKSSSRAALLKVLENLPSGWTYDLDPLDLL